MSEIKSQYYQIFFKGVELDEFRYSLIEEIVFEDNSTGSDLLTIRLNDPDFIFINDDIFIEEAQVKFLGGWRNDYRTMFEGYVSLIDITFPNTGSPQMIIHCMDNTHLMNRTKKKRTWENKKNSDVASSIFKEYGLKAVVDASPRVQESIAQSNETDISLLEKLASDELDPYLVYVENGTGYYVKKKILEKHQATLDYRDGDMNVIAFNPRINKEVKQVEVQKSDVNAKDKKIDKAEANDKTSRNTSGTSPETVDRRDNQTSWKYNGGSSWVSKK